MTKKPLKGSKFSKGKTGNDDAIKKASEAERAELEQHEKSKAEKAVAPAPATEEKADAPAPLQVSTGPETVKLADITVGALQLEGDAAAKLVEHTIKSQERDTAARVMAQHAATASSEAQAEAARAMSTAARDQADIAREAFEWDKGLREGELRETKRHNTELEARARTFEFAVKELATGLGSRLFAAVVLSAVLLSAALIVSAIILEGIVR